MPPGYTKVSLREPVAAETLRPVDDHVWTFYPELGAQSYGGRGGGGQHPPGTQVTKGPMQ